MSMPRYRAAAADSEQTPLGFELEVPSASKPDEFVIEQFLVPRPLPTVAVLDHALLEAESADESAIYLSLGRTLRAMLDTPEQWQRFRDVAGRARYDIGEIANIVRDILREAGRPTPPSSDSAGSPSSNGESSSGGLLPPAADPFSNTSEASPT